MFLFIPPVISSTTSGKGKGKGKLKGKTLNLTEFLNEGSKVPEGFDKKVINWADAMEETDNGLLPNFIRFNINH